VEEAVIVIVNEVVVVVKFNKQLKQKMINTLFQPKYISYVTLSSPFIFHRAVPSRFVYNRDWKTCFNRLT
jgi:hypothetical protein